MIRGKKIKSSKCSIKTIKKALKSKEFDVYYNKFILLKN